MDNRTRFRPVRQLIMLGSAIVLLLIAQPFLWKYVKSSAETLQVRRSEKQRIASIDSDIGKVKATIEQQNTAVGQLDVVFPTRDDTPQVVERLERLADEGRVEMQTQSIVEKENDVAGKKLPGLIPLTVSLQAIGTPADLLQYLDAIEHTPELDTVDSWTIQSFTDNSSGQPVIRHRLTADVAFYLMVN